MKKPTLITTNKCFSSGPCAKRPNWSVDVLRNAHVGRSHRSQECQHQIRDLLNKTRNILNIPNDYVIGITPASDTGAVEMALWNLLGSRIVDIIHFEEFGKTWFNDISQQLKLENRVFSADYGKCPDISTVNFDHDVVFTSNGTTSGVCIHNYDFIPNKRNGLVICDATSSIFSIPMNIIKFDVLTYSWQKSLGGEGQHGVIIMSPAAIKRLEEYRPTWPMPKILNLRNKTGVNMEFFNGSTINTPSMIAIADALDGLNWIESIGGLEVAYERVNANAKIIHSFIEKSDFLSNLCENQNFYSKTSICFQITSKWFLNMNNETQKIVINEIAKYLSDNNIGYDIINHKTAPNSFRIWCGPTIEKEDLEILIEWFEYAYNITSKKYAL